MSFLFVDRILEFIPGKTCKGLKHVTYDDIYLSYDKNHNLCFNPCMVGETIGQLAAWNAMFSFDFKKRPVAGVVESATVHRNALIGETILLEATINSLDSSAIQYNARASVGNEEIFSINNAIGPMLTMDDFIDEDLIRKQFQEISRPGEWSESPRALEEIKTKFTPNLVPMTYDKIIELDPGVRMVATKKISRQAPYFPDHFPNKPVLPMSVLLECKLNLTHRFIKLSGLNNSYTIQEMRKIKMNEFIYPGDEVVSSIIVKHQDENEMILRYRSEILGRRICVLEIIMLRDV